MEAVHATGAALVLEDGRIAWPEGRAGTHAVRLPLRWKGRQIGELVADRDTPFSNDERTLLASIAQQAAMALEHGRAVLRGGGAGDPLAWPHARPAGHLCDARPVGGAEDELVAALVVEVDEAGVGLERRGDLLRDEVEHLLEVERRVDGGSRLRQQAEVALGCVHDAYRRSP
jgi:GAF domain-containing protein